MITIALAGLLATTPTTTTENYLLGIKGVRAIELETHKQRMVAVAIQIGDVSRFVHISESAPRPSGVLMLGDKQCFVLSGFVFSRHLVCVAEISLEQRTVALWEASNFWVTKSVIEMDKERAALKANPQSRYLEVNLPDPSIPPKKFKSFSEIPADVAGFPILLGISSAVPIEIKSKPMTLINFGTGIPTEFDANKSNLFVNGKPCQYLQKSKDSDSCLTEKTSGPITLHVGADREAAWKSILGLVAQFEEIPTAVTRIKFKTQTDVLNVNTFNTEIQVKNLKAGQKETVESFGTREQHDSFVSVEFTGNPEILSRNLNQLFLGKYKCKVGYKNIRFGQFICVAPRSKTVVPLWVAPKEFLNTSKSEAEISVAQEEAKKLGQLMDVKVVNLKELNVKDAQEYARER
jgi:hypothetical protein